MALVWRLYLVAHHGSLPYAPFFRKKVFIPVLCKLDVCGFQRLRNNGCCVRSSVKKDGWRMWISPVSKDFDMLTDPPSYPLSDSFATYYVRFHVLVFDSSCSDHFLCVGIQLSVARTAGKRLVRLFGPYPASRIFAVSRLISSGDDVIQRSWPGSFVR